MDLKIEIIKFTAPIKGRFPIFHNPFFINHFYNLWEGKLKQKHYKQTSGIRKWVDSIENVDDKMVNDITIIQTIYP